MIATIKGRKVEVRDRQCCWRRCLIVGRYTYRSPGAGASGRFSWTADRDSCLTRDNHGCPLDPSWARPEDICTCKDGPRFRSRVLKGGWGKVRCIGRGELMPCELVVRARDEEGGEG